MTVITLIKANCLLIDWAQLLFHWMKMIVMEWKQLWSHWLKKIVMKWRQLLWNGHNCCVMKTTVVLLNEDNCYKMKTTVISFNEDNCYGMTTTVIEWRQLLSHWMKMTFMEMKTTVMEWRQMLSICAPSLHYLWVSAGVTYLTLSDNAKYGICATSQYGITFGFPQVSHIWHCLTMPILRTMSIVWSDNSKCTCNAIFVARQC